MEAFSGSLTRYRLSLLMPALIEGAPLTGTLTLTRGSLLREFIFDQGFLVGECSNDPHEHLSQLLVDLEVLDAEAAASAFAAAEALNVLFGEYLVDRNVVERGRVLDALEHKARESLFDCYLWESGDVAMSPMVKKHSGVRLALQAGPLHRDGVGRMDEWRQFREALGDDDVTFTVYRACAADWSGKEEDALIDLAEAGASLGELLATARLSRFDTARRVLGLYRRGVLAPQSNDGVRIGHPTELWDLLDLAREMLGNGDPESAAVVAEQALQRGPVAEAQAIYREAERQLIGALAERLNSYDGRLIFRPMPRAAPSVLTADDVYLYTRLRSARSSRSALQSASMGTLAAYRSLQRLITAGLVSIEPVQAEHEPAQLRATAS
jgi:hypothetical protein